MRTLLIACAMSLLSTPTVLAASNNITPGKELAQTIFGSIEDNPSGSVDMGEFVAFGNDIFASMDTDDSESIDPSEFSQWDFGFNFIAENVGQKRAYETAQKVIFANWDHDANGEISNREYRKSMNWDFRRADVDDNALLTREEFLCGYVVIFAYRSAIIGQ